MPSIRTVLRDIHDHGLDPKQRLKLEPGAKRLGEAAPGRAHHVVAKEEKPVKAAPVKSALVELPPPPPPVVEPAVEEKVEEVKPEVQAAEVEAPKKPSPKKKGDKKDKPEEPPVS